MDKITLGFCVTGSFCTLAKTLNVLKELKEKNYTIYPILSYHVKNEDTRFFAAQDFRERIADICDHEIIDSLALAEPLGPKLPCDVMCIVPCTGNTIAKIAQNITDTPVTMAAKAHLRNEKPLVIAVSTNDGLGANAAHIGTLLTRKNVYFVPYGQDDPVKKPRSLVADFDRVEETIQAALEGKQIQPILL